MNVTLQRHLQSLQLAFWSVFSSNPVDKLGLLRARLSDLRKEERRIEDSLRDVARIMHLGTRPLRTVSIEGRIFSAKIVPAERESVSWKDIAEALAPSRQLVTAYTTKVEYVAVRVNAKLKGA